jgi:hypothetical protein
MNYDPDVTDRYEISWKRLLVFADLHLDEVTDPHHLAALSDAIGEAGMRAGHPPSLTAREKGHMGQISMKTIRLSGSVLVENQHGRNL